MVHAEKTITGVETKVLKRIRLRAGLNNIFRENLSQQAETRVRPFRLKNFFTYKRNKVKLDPFHMCFTISLCVSLFHYKISLLFFRFFLLIFASNFSLRFAVVIFAWKQNKGKQNSSLFFAFFRLKFFALLPFSNFCFEAKQSKAKFKYFFSLFFRFFAFFAFFAFFFAFFHLIIVTLRFFCLIFAYFTFIFASDFWCVALK
jgi:hypothetical protein